MATAFSTSVNVKDYGVSTTVPDDDVARLMYYLHCITVGVGLDILQDDLVQYKHYYLLTPARIAIVFKTAIELSPDVLINKLIFLDDEGEVTRTSSNTFVSISAACNVVSLQSDIVIAGKVQNVTKVMFFKSSWLKKYYVGPVERIARAIIGTKHCGHCDGDDRICTCTQCPRSEESKCQPFFNALLDAFLPPPTSSAPASKRAPSPSPKPPSDQHQCNCDGCGWQLFTGFRYKCTVCDDYDLCSPCYKRNVHDLTHPFMQINTPGAKPTYLSARRAAAPTTSNKATFSRSQQNPISNRREPAVDRNPPPPPYTMGDGRNSPSSSPFFYTTMSVSELKDFLKDRSVDFGDIRDKETLCRRAWDTYCDCMSVFELNKFLTDNNISTAGCRDVNSRRQKAKDSFLPPSRPSRPSPSRDKSSTRFRFKKEDTVILTGLTRAEMNGKMGEIVSIDHAEGKALVRVDALDKTFKIKLDNLRIQDDELEELE